MSCVLCLVTVNVMWPYLAVPRVGLQCVIVLFPDQTHLHFGAKNKNQLMPSYSAFDSVVSKEPLSGKIVVLCQLFPVMA